jgi:hypothetical protein
MGIDAGPCGVFGIYLPKYVGKSGYAGFKDLYYKILRYGNNLADIGLGDEEDEDALEFGITNEEYYLGDDAWEAKVNKKFLEEVKAYFKKNGIVLPEGVRLHWTGGENDRPARCSTPYEEWCLGHGMLMDPWDWPEMHESYRKVAEFHEWVWMG